MAQAYQCDRCRQYFAAPEKVDSTNMPYTCFFGNAEKIWNSKTIYSCDVTQLNLCPGCLAALNDFLREGEPKQIKKKHSLKNLFIKKEKN